MGRHSKKNRANRSARRPSITMVLIVLAMFAIGAATVVSRQSLSATQSTKTTSAVLNHTANQDPGLSAADHVTQQDHDSLAGGLKDVINQSTEGLAEVHHSDGSVSVNLEDRFQSVTVARDSNGRLSQSCVDNPQAAGAFFNIDPKLIDNKSRAPVAPATKE
ncbi:MAG TPA: hypothetical protein VJV03_17420 [Pyrinomonadaceae bacterium]|nr:hypothetical protein [Pyrinomonadaceae bacterium]